MMSDTPHGRQKEDPPPKTPEQIAAENALFNSQVCPCEEIEPEALSEYEVPDEWITYTGEVDPSIYEYAARNAESEAASILRLCEEEDFNQMEQEHTRTNALYSDSSSDEQISPPRVRNERRALMVPAKAMRQPLQPTDKATPSAPPFNEAALTMPAFGEAAVSAPTQAVAANQEAPNQEIINEWSVLITSEKARDVNAKSKEATNNETLARSMAEAAEFSGHQDAARLAAESVRCDIYAAQNAQTALNAEEHSVHVAQAFARASTTATVEGRAIVDAPPIDEVVPSAPAAMYAPMGEPALREPAPSVHAIEEAAATGPFQADAANRDAPIEIINEWSVFIATENARKAVAKSLEATNKATLARNKAEAAEYHGYQDAARLAAESVRYDICAAQSAQLALNAEAYAALVTQKLARARKVAAEESEVALKAPPTNSVEKKE